MQVRPSGSPDPGGVEDDAFAKTRASLLDRLADWDDGPAWVRFYDTYWRVIHSYAIRSGLRHDEAMDVVQETVLAVAKQMREGRFDRTRGTFKSWLRNLTRWRVQDQVRKRDRPAEAAVHTRESATRLTATCDRFPDPADPEAGWDDEWREAVLTEALAAVRNQVAPRQYQIFECHVVKGWDVPKVCRELGVSRMQVYLAKNRIQPLVRERAEKLERDGRI
jgi:RNA polymerase sigma-70 factor (ECF subfamily)